MAIRLPPGPLDPPRHSKKRKSSAAEQQELDERLAENALHRGGHEIMCAQAQSNPGSRRPASCSSVPAATAGAAGSVKTKERPGPGRSSSQMRPPLASPRGGRTRGPDRCRAPSGQGIRMPSAPAPLALTVTAPPPSGLNLIALPTRFPALDQALPAGGRRDARPRLQRRACARGAASRSASPTSVPSDARLRGSVGAALGRPTRSAVFSAERRSGLRASAGRGAISMARWRGAADLERATAVA